MKNWKRVVVLCMSLGVVACGGGSTGETTPETTPEEDPAETTVTAEPEPPVAELVAPDAAEAPFVGHWRNRDVTTVIMTLNGAGRVRMDLGGGSCYGSYVITDGAMTMTYDPNQSGCEDFAVQGLVSEDGQSLRFSVYTTYDRIDATNEAF